MFMMKTVMMELQQPTALLLGWDKFPDAKKSVMKDCNSVVIGDGDGYLYQMGALSWVAF
jgi:hypothetical protein